MLKVTLICDLVDDRKDTILTLLQTMQEGAVIQDCAFLDLGSKKSQRKARGYLSKYAASEIFIVFERTTEVIIDTDEYGDPIEEPTTSKKVEVLDVIYKEQIHKNNWIDAINQKITKLVNENK